MLGLPKTTEMSKQLPKKAIYTKFQMNTAAKEKIDVDISRITIVNEIAPNKVNITSGEDVKSFFVLLVSLKNKEYDEKTIATLSKLIPQNILFVLEYEDESRLAIYHTKVMQTAWMPTEEQKVELKGLNLDTVWENIVIAVGGVNIEKGNSLDEQIEINPVDLSDKLQLTLDDDNGTMHSWSLEMYSDESKSRVMENGHRVYVYKLRQIDDGEETVPRVQFTRADGSVMTESKFQALLTDQFRNYKISVYQGLLDEQIYKATFTTADGQTFTRPIKLGTGTLKVRGNNDTTYRAIENNTIPSVNPQEKDIMLVSTAQTDTQYYINNSGISASSDGVKLMVDHSLDDALLSAYINRTSNPEGKYSYQFRYLDLVDTSNGNTYVTMGAGQKMNLYWPVPSDAKSNSEFHIIHFKGIDRDSDVDVNELLTTRIPEELTCETVTIGGQKFVKFAVDSFSPFALLYEKDMSTPTQPSGGEAPNQPGTPDTPVTPNQPNTSDVPSNPGTPDRTPKTGDTMNLALWISLMGLSLAGLFISLVVVKKRTRRNRHSN